MIDYTTERQLIQAKLMDLDSSLRELEWRVKETRAEITRWRRYEDTLFGPRLDRVAASSWPLKLLAYAQMEKALGSGDAKGLITLLYNHGWDGKENHRDFVIRFRRGVISEALSSSSCIDQVK